MSTETLDLHQWHFQAVARIPRPRPQVWQEWEQDDHPAWSNGSHRHLKVEGPQGLVVGAAVVCVTPPQGPSALRIPMLSTITHVWPGWSRTVEVLTGNLEHTETIALTDDGPGATIATLSAWARMTCTASHAIRAREQFHRSGQQYLDAAAAWTPAPS